MTTFWSTFKETLSPKTWKNGPIWSHCNKPQRFWPIYIMLNNRQTVQCMCRVDISLVRFITGPLRSFYCFTFHWWIGRLRYAKLAATHWPRFCVQLDKAFTETRLAVSTHLHHSIGSPWSCLVEGDEQPVRPNSQTCLECCRASAT